MKAAVHLLNYAATHLDAVVRFYASNMILIIHSNSAYLSEPKVQSHVGGYFFLVDHDDKDPTSPPPSINGAIHVESSIMGNVMTSASKAKTGALFVNRKEGAYMGVILEEMGWPRPGPTPIQTDNSVEQRRSKAIDMEFYWMQDRVCQGQFRMHWKPGSTNYPNYPAKNHPTSHHQAIRPLYLVCTQEWSPSTPPRCPHSSRVSMPLTGHTLTLPMAAHSTLRRLRGCVDLGIPDTHWLQIHPIRSGLQ